MMASASSPGLRPSSRALSIARAPYGIFGYRWLDTFLARSGAGVPAVTRTSGDCNHSTEAGTDGSLPG